MEAERNDGVNIAGSSMTYAEYYEQWVKDYKYGNLKPTTEHLYKHRIVVIRDLFGNITLSQLSHAILQKKMDEYGETRQKTTVNVLFITVKASLKDALYDGYIPRDIFSRVKPHSDLEPVFGVTTAMAFPALVVLIIATVFTFLQHPTKGTQQTN